MSNSDQEPNKGPSTLAEVLELLKTKAQELLFVQPARVPALQQEIQKLRIVASIFREIEHSVNDRDLYKEMNLLNRMMVGKDLEQEAERRRADESIAAAADKLRDSYGVSPQSANRIARAISAVGGMSGPEPDPDEPQPIEPDSIN
jgi:hypothetical protein